ncbi:hypothetical protein MA16_Dca026757 [Dendrobium catenatum]|uniref:Uncharacterized protein n=1 Tax=Dendrobium catenatum TaxID=906689 RepID=A0A2I0V923_9ASPA|nr:hypothetical protein MA16_Dca026757 [Dendrobium catenatum]
MGSLTVPVTRRAVAFPPPGGTYKSFRPRKEKGTPGSPGLAVCVEPVSLLPRPLKACLGSVDFRDLAEEEREREKVTFLSKRAPELLPTKMPQLPISTGRESRSGSTGGGDGSLLCAWESSGEPKEIAEEEQRSLNEIEDAVVLISDAKTTTSYEVAGDTKLDLKNSQMLILQKTTTKQISEPYGGSRFDTNHKLVPDGSKGKEVVSANCLDHKVSHYLDRGNNSLEAFEKELPTILLEDKNNSVLVEPDSKHSNVWIKTPHIKINFKGISEENEEVNVEEDVIFDKFLSGLDENNRFNVLSHKEDGIEDVNIVEYNLLDEDAGENVVEAAVIEDSSKGCDGINQDGISVNGMDSDPELPSNGNVIRCNGNKKCWKNNEVLSDLQEVTVSENLNSKALVCGNDHVFIPGNEITVEKNVARVEADFILINEDTPISIKLEKVEISIILLIEVNFEDYRVVEGKST